MSWNQLRDADMNVGYTGGWCLKYVQDAFHTDHVYPTAIAAWEAEPNKHTDRPPSGITVPVYFSLGNVPAGHVAIELSDGWVASSTQPGTHSTPYYHKSLDDLIGVYGQYNGGCTYLGWGEHVGTAQVVQYVPDVVLATADQVQQDYRDILERDADANGIAHYTQYTNDFVRQDLQNSQEYKDLQARKAAEAEAAKVAAAAAQPAPTPVIAPIHNPEVTPVPEDTTTTTTTTTVDDTVFDLPVIPVPPAPAPTHWSIKALLSGTTLAAIVSAILATLKALNIL